MDNKGQTGGLSILLAVIATVFVLGILVMLFVLTNAEVQDTIADDESGSVTNESVTTLSNTSADSLARAEYPRCVATVTNVYNGTINLNATTNYVVSGCTITAVGSTVYTHGGAKWNVSYSYTYANPTTYGAVNDTKVAIGDTSDWFGIIILVGIIVGVLGLVALVIVLLRRSGMFGGGEGAGRSSGGGLFGGGSGDMLE